MGRLNILKLTIAMVSICVIWCAEAETIEVSRDSAVSIACRIVGGTTEKLKTDAGSGMDSGIVAALITAVDTLNPFVADEIHGRSAWRVSVSLSSSWSDSSAGISVLKFPSRVFSVYIDAETGLLLYAISRAAHWDAELAQRPTRTIAEEQLAHSSDHYKTLSDTEPSTSLSDAIDQSLSNPWTAMEVVAVCVMHSWGAEHARPVWVIDVFGGSEDPHMASREGVPDRQSHHLRTLVDATTGEPLLASSHPYAP